MRKRAANRVHLLAAALMTVDPGSLPLHLQSRQNAQQTLYKLEFLLVMSSERMRKRVLKSTSNPGTRASTYIERQPRRRRALLASAISPTSIDCCGRRYCYEPSGRGNLYALSSCEGADGYHNNRGASAVKQNLNSALPRQSQSWNETFIERYGLM